MHICMSWVRIARAQAAEADRRIASGDAAPLTGIPLALKDVLVTTDAPTTAGSKMLDGYRSPYDATVVDAAARPGCGIPRQDEHRRVRDGFAAPKTARTVRHITRGAISTACRAALQVARRRRWRRERRWARLGRIPAEASANPRVSAASSGMKPTYSRVSRYGLIAFASSLDHIGPFTRTVEDAAILLGAIAGHDPRDSTSLDRSGAGLPRRPDRRSARSAARRSRGVFR